MVDKKEKAKVGLRRKSRTIALNILYLIDNCSMSVDNAINCVFNEVNDYPDNFKNFTAALVAGTVQNKNLIDETIQNYLHNWTLERMAVIDRNIIRISTFEFMAFPETPVSVIINEAIEIAKEYSTRDSGRFVNGLLDKIKDVRNNSSIMQRFQKNETPQL